MSSVEAARKYRAYDCMACGHCTYSCPAAHGERRFSPRRFMEEFSQQGSPEGLDIWSCMGCAACTTVCPQGVDFHHFMREVRQERRSMDPPVRTHAGLVSAIRDLDSVGKGKGHHHQWVTPDLELDQRSDVALFVGCVPTLDVVFRDFQSGLPGLPRSAVRLLNAMGIRPRLLKDERCCGHDAYWLGETDTFERLAKMNLCAIRESGIHTLVTYCPECNHTIGKVYEERFGALGFEVVHLSQLLEQGIRDGRLNFQRSDEVFTFQDPCRLGRGSGIYDAPRNLIKGMGQLAEMTRSGANAACCGSTCFAQCDRITKSWQLTRLEEARATGAGRLVTACPKCLVHLSCAQKEMGTYIGRPRIEIVDLFTLAESNLKR